MICNTFLILGASKLKSPTGHCERQHELLGQNKQISSYYGPTVINDVIGNICPQDEFFKI